MGSVDYFGDSNTKMKKFYLDPDFSIRFVIVCRCSGGRWGLQPKKQTQDCKSRVGLVFWGFFLFFFIFLIFVFGLYFVSFELLNKMHNNDGKIISYPRKY